MLTGQGLESLEQRAIPGYRKVPISYFKVPTLLSEVVTFSIYVSSTDPEGAKQLWQALRSSIFRVRVTRI